MRLIGQMAGIIGLTLMMLGTATAEQMLRRTIDHDGVEREYFVHVPSDAAGELPVVLAIHGYTSTATGFQFAHDLNRHADQHGYIVVYPQGSHFQVSNEQGESFRITTWNPFGAEKPEPNAGPQCAADATCCIDWLAVARVGLQQSLQSFLRCRLDTPVVLVPNCQ